MKFRVLVTARSFGKSDQAPVSLLERHGAEITRNPLDRPLKAEELKPLVKELNALIVGNDQVTADVIRATSKLVVISRYGVGYDNIDLAAATERGIVVTNTPNTNSNSVADITIALMLSVARNIRENTNNVKGGGWSRGLGVDLFEKTVGIVGTGTIGKAVARRLSGFDVKLLLCDPYSDLEFAKQIGASYVELHDVLTRSDFVSLHAPAIPETENLIDEKELSLMKESAYLINTSRGALINEEALYNSLTGKKIAGAALDVLVCEPPLDRRLVELDNVLVTPHIGGYTKESVNRMGMLAAQNVIDVLKNQECRFIVNPAVLEVGKE